MPGSAAGVLSAGLCLEIRETHVLPAAVSSCAGDPKIQCTGLPAEDGAIPESGQEGQTGAKDEEAEGLCIFRGR